LWNVLAHAIVLGALVDHAQRPEVSGATELPEVGKERIGHRDLEREKSRGLMERG